MRSIKTHGIAILVGLAIGAYLFHRVSAKVIPLEKVDSETE